MHNIRQTRLGIGGISLQLPCFFPSISSVKTNLYPIEYLSLLVTIEHPLVLISAYDIHNSSEEHMEEMKELVDIAMKKDTIVVIDSGNYESYWLRDNGWNIKHYRNILMNIRHHLAFCYDYLDLNQDEQELTDNIEKQALADQTSSEGTIIPIVHAAKELFPEIVSRLVDTLNPLIVGIPERELGVGIIERAKTVARIRQRLDQRKQYYPIHLLGTGNPLSMLIYTACGADSFDGLEWCQNVIDYNTGLIYHLQQRDFFGNHIDTSKMAGLSYFPATLIHNLQFYTMWMCKIHSAIVSNTIVEMLNRYLRKTFVMQLRKQLPGVFDAR